MVTKVVCDECNNIINGWIYYKDENSICNDCADKYRAKEINRLVKKFKRREK